MAKSNNPYLAQAVPGPAPSREASIAKWLQQQAEANAWDPGPKPAAATTTAAAAAATTTVAAATTTVAAATTTVAAATTTAAL